MSPRILVLSLASVLACACVSGCSHERTEFPPTTGLAEYGLRIFAALDVRIFNHADTLKLKAERFPPFEDKRNLPPGVIYRWTLSNPQDAKQLPITIDLMGVDLARPRAVDEHRIIISETPVIIRIRPQLQTADQTAILTALADRIEE